MMVHEPFKNPVSVQSFCLSQTAHAEEIGRVGSITKMKQTSSEIADASNQFGPQNHPIQPVTGFQNKLHKCS